MILVCNKCKTPAFAVSRFYAEQEIKRFNEYFYSLTEIERSQYYGDKPSNISNYENCMYCNSYYKSFRIPRDGELRTGESLGPIITNRIKLYFESINSRTIAQNVELKDT